MVSASVFENQVNISKNRLLCVADVAARRWNGVKNTAQSRCQFYCSHFIDAYRSGIIHALNAGVFQQANKWNLTNEIMRDIFVDRPCPLNGFFTERF